MIAGMFISPDGLDKTELFLFCGLSKQNNTIFNDLEVEKRYGERIFYTYLVICRISGILNHI